jgi:ABC-type proline/glycine betaine transport system permease subunit
VSPLAWLPIGLLVFKSANPAAIWSIFICSIWPMVINTAVGVQRVPQDYMNVARVLNLSEWKVFTKILLPSVLPYMLTGVRLAIGTAWLVIVAAEMLTGGVGIGFWVWDEWNNLNVAHIIIAIVVIGVVGLLLEQALMALARALHLRTSRGLTMNDPKFIEVEGVEMVFATRRALPRAARNRPDGAQGRVHHADRPLGLRQVDAAQPDRRPAEADRAC